MRRGTVPGTTGSPVSPALADCCSLQAGCSPAPLWKDGIPIFLNRCWIIARIAVDTNWQQQDRSLDTTCRTSVLCIAAAGATVAAAGVATVDFAGANRNFSASGGEENPRGNRGDTSRHRTLLLSNCALAKQKVDADRTRTDAGSAVPSCVPFLPGRALRREPRRR
eukprot:gene15159-biopygen629